MSRYNVELNNIIQIPESDNYIAVYSVIDSTPKDESKLPWCVAGYKAILTNDTLREKDEVLIGEVGDSRDFAESISDAILDLSSLVKDTEQAILDFKRIYTDIDNQLTNEEYNFIMASAVHGMNCINEMQPKQIIDKSIDLMLEMRKRISGHNIK